jgi:hypothetical protein
MFLVCLFYVLVFPILIATSLGRHSENSAFGAVEVTQTDVWWWSAMGVLWWSAVGSVVVECCGG